MSMTLFRWESFVDGTHLQQTSQLTEEHSLLKNQLVASGDMTSAMVQPPKPSPNQDKRRSTHVSHHRPPELVSNQSATRSLYAGLLRWSWYHDPEATRQRLLIWLLVDLHPQSWTCHSFACRDMSNHGTLVSVDRGWRENHGLSRSTFHVNL